MNPSNIIVVILAILIAVVIGLTLSYYFKIQEKRIFNKGVCIECKVPLQRIGNENNQIRTYYCPKCHSMLAVYFNVDKNVDLVNYKMTEDEDEEMVEPDIAV